MNHISVTTVLLSMFFGAGVMAAPAEGSDSEGTIHVGIKLGQTTASSSPMGFAIHGGYTLYGAGTFDGSDFTSRLSVALEGEWANLNIFSVSDNKVYRASSEGVAGVASYPINAKFAAIARAGLSRVSHTIDCGQPRCNSNTRIGLLGGVAGQYWVSRLMSVRAGYDIYPGNFRMIAVNAVYKY